MLLFLSAIRHRGLRCKFPVECKVAPGRDAPTEVTAHGSSLHLAPGDRLLVKRKRAVEAFDHRAGSCFPEGETCRGAEADIALVGIHDRIGKPADMPHNWE